MSEKPKLADMLAVDIPPAFLKKYVEAVSLAYSDAHAAVENDPAIDGPEQKYLHGHMRRARVEAKTRRLAVEHGLSIKQEQNKQGSSEHVQLNLARFDLSVSHVCSPNAFPKDSDQRKQQSSINAHLDQTDLFPVETEVPKDRFYGIIIHTENPASPEQLGAIAIGFPNEEFTKWLQQPTPLQDIIDRQDAIYRKPNDLQAQVQKPKAKWKGDVVPGKGDEKEKAE